MIINPCKLSDFSTAQVNYSLCEYDRYKTILIISFEGIAQNSHEHCGTFKFMEAKILQGISAWQPLGVILDFTKLAYSWGDNMNEVLGATGAYYRMEYPYKVVISDLNKEGLKSFIECEWDEDPKKILVESIENALKELKEEIDNQTLDLI